MRALIGGIGVAAVAGPLGCFVVWRRMAYFGDSLSHSALLGVALGLAVGMDLNAGIIVACAGLAPRERLDQLEVAQLRQSPRRIEEAEPREVDDAIDAELPVD